VKVAPTQAGTIQSVKEITLANERHHGCILGLVGMGSKKIKNIKKGQKAGSPLVMANRLNKLNSAASLIGRQ
jgi:hypothetical protein